jgi:putative oxidoreductase
MKLFSIKASDTAFSIGMLILRLGAGGLLIVNHGYPKLMGFAEKSQTFGDPLGIGGPASMGLAIFAEFFCPALVVLGLFTRLASIPVVILFLVILLKISKDLTAGPGGGELAALFLVVYLGTLFMGPGKFSLDRFIGRK